MRLVDRLTRFLLNRQIRRMPEEQRKYCKFLVLTADLVAADVVDGLAVVTVAKDGQPYLSLLGQIKLEHIKAGYLQARAMDARANAPTAPFGSREFATQVADQLHKQYPDLFPAGRA